MDPQLVRDRLITEGQTLEEQCGSESGVSTQTQDDSGPCSSKEEKALKLAEE